MKGKLWKLQGCNSFSLSGFAARQCVTFTLPNFEPKPMQISNSKTMQNTALVDDFRHNSKKYISHLRTIINLCVSMAKKVYELNRIEWLADVLRICKRDKVPRTQIVFFFLET